MIVLKKLHTKGDDAISFKVLYFLWKNRFVNANGIAPTFSPTPFPHRLLCIGCEQCTDSASDKRCKMANFMLDTSFDLMQIIPKKIRFGMSRKQGSINLRSGTY